MDKKDADTEFIVGTKSNSSPAGTFLFGFPLLQTLYRRLRSVIRKEDPFTSTSYWAERYKAGGNSGLGSYGQYAEFKAEILNEFVAKYAITTIIEFGCGDGNQLKLSSYPSYLGYDVSDVALSKCRAMFSDDSRKSFKLIGDYDNETAELALSLDVIYHLVEDEVFDSYMRRLFNAAERFVIVYSSNFEDPSYQTSLHVRHRKFTQWVDDNIRNWSLIQHIPNRYPSNQEGTQGASADFYLYAIKN